MINKSLIWPLCCQNIPATVWSEMDLWTIFLYLNKWNFCFTIIIGGFFPTHLDTMANVTDFGYSKTNFWLGPTRSIHFQWTFPKTEKLKSGFSVNKRTHHYLLSSELQKLDLELHNYCLLRHQQLQLYKILWRTKCSEMTLGAQSFTSLKANLSQDLNEGFVFSRCLY